MDVLSAAAASGMRSRMDSLDMLANNIANSSAPGYKGDREFYSTYLAAEAAASPDDIGSVMPVVERPWTDLSQGSLTPTGGPLDVALRGKGFFVATSNSGPLLTRDGSFRISIQGELQTQDGLPVQGQDGKPIQLDTTRPVEITPDGEVIQDKQSMGAIKILDVKDAGALSKQGTNYFGFSADDSFPAASAQVQQGSLESANLQPAESAVRLVSVMRQFEMLQKAVAIGSDMSRRVIEDVAKVTA